MNPTPAPRDERQARLAALHEQLTTEVTRLMEGADWQAMLRAAARFHRYSFGNVLLICAQRPDATRVAGYRTWHALGRQVRRGERGIAILAPVVYRARSTPEPTGQAGAEPPRKDSEDGAAQRVPQVRGFKVEHVFDLSQTDGEPVPEVRPVQLTGDAPAALWGELAAQVENAGYTLERGDCVTARALGETDPKRRTVTVRDDLEPAQAGKSLAHELAHIELGHTLEGYVDCRGRCEVEAESVAYLVMAEAGLETAGYSLPYVANWTGGDPKVLTETAEHVIETGRRIAGRFTGLELMPDELVRERGGLERTA